MLAHRRWPDPNYHKRRGFSIWKNGKLISPTPLSEYNPVGIDWLLAPDEEAIINPIRAQIEKQGRDYVSLSMDRYDRPYPPKEFQESTLMQVDYQSYAYRKYNSGWVPKTTKSYKPRRIHLVVTMSDLRVAWRAALQNKESQ